MLNYNLGLVGAGILLNLCYVQEVQRLRRIDKATVLRQTFALQLLSGGSATLLLESLLEKPELAVAAGNIR